MQVLPISRPARTATVWLARFNDVAKTLVMPGCPLSIRRIDEPIKRPLPCFIELLRVALWLFPYAARTVAMLLKRMSGARQAISVRLFASL